MKDQITIIGKKWFDRVYGNTYHSVKVWVNGKLVGNNPYEYGYGEQYIQSAHDILVATDNFKGDYSAFCQDRMNHRDNFIIEVSDVSRKKDL